MKEAYNDDLPILDVELGQGEDDEGAWDHPLVDEPFETREYLLSARSLWRLGPNGDATAKELEGSFLAGRI